MNLLLFAAFGLSIYYLKWIKVCHKFIKLEYSLAIFTCYSSTIFRDELKQYDELLVENCELKETIKTLKQLETEMQAEIRYLLQQLMEHKKGGGTPTQVPSVNNEAADDPDEGE